MEEGDIRGRAGTGRSGGASAGHTHVMKRSQAQQNSSYCHFVLHLSEGALKTCRGATKTVTSE